jgi:uncharacterized protein YaaN involved in tellurite resistance
VEKNEIAGLLEELKREPNKIEEDFENIKPMIDGGKLRIESLREYIDNSKDVNRDMRNVGLEKSVAVIGQGIERLEKVF